MPVLVGFEIRHGEITIALHRRFCSVRWTIGSLDKCAALSDCYMLNSEGAFEWYKDNVKTWLRESAPASFVQGCIRWGSAKGLTIEGAQALAQSINQQWGKSILNWLADGSPTKRALRMGRRICVGDTWGCE